MIDLSLQKQTGFDNESVLGDSTTPVQVADGTARSQVLAADGEFVLTDDPEHRPGVVVNVRCGVINKNGGTVRFRCQSGDVSGVATPIESSFAEDAKIDGDEVVQFVHHPGGKFVVFDSILAGGGGAASIPVLDVWLSPYNSNNQ